MGEGEVIFIRREWRPKYREALKGRVSRQVEEVGC